MTTQNDEVPLATASGWARLDRFIGKTAEGLDPQELRVTRLTAAFSLALVVWGPLFAAFYALVGAYRLSVFVGIAVAFVGAALTALRRGRRVLSSHLLLTGLLGVLLAIGAYTRTVFSPTLMWLPVLPIVGLLLLGRRAAIVWGVIPIVSVFLFTAAALTGNEGEGLFSGSHLIAYHSVSLLSTIALQFSLALLFESAKVRMGEELAAQRDLATRARDEARQALEDVERAEVTRRLLSDQLVRAEERSRMKSDFLASTSHELRTPLNTIINIPQGILDILLAPRSVRCSGCGQTFELDQGETVPAACPTCQSALVLLPQDQLEPEVTAKLLRSVVTSGKHLLTVVNDILDYSRLEAGGQLLVRESTKLSAILDQLEGVIAPVARLARVGLVLRSDTAPETQLLVDRVKLAQVLINLVSNAIKFSNGEGEVEVSTSAFEEEGHGWILLEVRDHGIGIAPENLRLIFEGFRQVDHGPSRRYGGTGLGLAISKRLVELHGGRLEVESTLGTGSTFRVRLPISPGDPKGDDEATGPLVLIIDDEPAAAEAAAIALRPLGWRVVALREPAKAVQRVRELRPDVVMLDVMMPRLSGFEVLKALLEDPLAPGLKVLVTSAYPDNRSVAEALGVKFMEKPWVADDLRAFMQTPPLRGHS